MVLKRKRAYGRRSGRRVKRRVMNGRRRVRRSLRPSRLAVTRIRVDTPWFTTTTSTNDFWRYYQPDAASAVNNFAEFAAVFDEYKISAIKYYFRPRFTDVDISGSATAANTAHTALIVVDPASETVPTGVYGSGSQNVLLEQSGCRMRDGMKPFSVYYKPKVAMPYNAAGAVKYVPMGYASTNDINIPLRGFHIYIKTNSGTAPTQVYDVSLKVYMTFRNLK